MDINEAKEISKTDCSRCNRLVATDCTCLEVAQAISFIEGHDSREEEVGELKILINRQKTELLRLHELECLSEITEKDKKSLETIRVLQTDNSCLRNHLKILKEKIGELNEAFQ